MVQRNDPEMIRVMAAIRVRVLSGWSRTQTRAELAELLHARERVVAEALEALARDGLDVKLIGSIEFVRVRARLRELLTPGSPRTETLVNLASRLATTQEVVWRALSALEEEGFDVRRDAFAAEITRVTRVIRDRLLTAGGRDRSINQLAQLADTNRGTVVLVLAQEGLDGARSVAAEEPRVASAKRVLVAYFHRGGGDTGHQPIFELAQVAGTSETIAARALASLRADELSRVIRLLRAPIGRAIQEGVRAQRSQRLPSLALLADFAHTQESVVEVALAALSHEEGLVVLDADDQGHLVWRTAFGSEWIAVVLRFEIPDMRAGTVLDVGSLAARFLTSRAVVVSALKGLTAETLLREQSRGTERTWSTLPGASRVASYVIKWRSRARARQWLPSAETIARSLSMTTAAVTEALRNVAVQGLIVGLGDLGYTSPGPVGESQHQRVAAEMIAYEQQWRALRGQDPLTPRPRPAGDAALASVFRTSISTAAMVRHRLVLQGLWMPGDRAEEIRFYVLARIAALDAEDPIPSIAELAQAFGIAPAALDPVEAVLTALTAEGLLVMVGGYGYVRAGGRFESPRQRARRRVREYVGSLTYGARLEPEAELAERLGLGPDDVRAALVELERLALLRDVGQEHEPRWQRFGHPDPIVLASAGPVGNEGAMFQWAVSLAGAADMMVAAERLLAAVRRVLLVDGRPGGAWDALADLRDAVRACEAVGLSLEHIREAVMSEAGEPDQAAGTEERWGAVLAVVADPNAPWDGLDVPLGIYAGARPGGSAAGRVPREVMLGRLRLLQRAAGVLLHTLRLEVGDARRLGQTERAAAGDAIAVRWAEVVRSLDDGPTDPVRFLLARNEAVRLRALARLNGLPAFGRQLQPWVDAVNEHFARLTEAPETPAQPLTAILGWVQSRDVDTSPAVAAAVDGVRAVVEAALQDVSGESASDEVESGDDRAAEVGWQDALRAAVELAGVAEADLAALRRRLWRELVLTRHWGQVTLARRWREILAILDERRRAVIAWWAPTGVWGDPAAMFERLRQAQTLSAREALGDVLAGVYALMPLGTRVAAPAAMAQGLGLPEAYVTDVRVLLAQGGAIQRGGQSGSRTTGNARRRSPGQTVADRIQRDLVDRRSEIVTAEGRLLPMRDLASRYGVSERSVQEGFEILAWRHVLDAHGGGRVSRGLPGVPSTQDRVAGQLRDWLMNWGDAGDRIGRLSELAARFGVSESMIGGALKILAREGWIVRPGAPRPGALVGPEIAQVRRRYAAAQETGGAQPVTAAQAIDAMRAALGWLISASEAEVRTHRATWVLALRVGAYACMAAGVSLQGLLAWIDEQIDAEEDATRRDRWALIAAALSGPSGPSSPGPSGPGPSGPGPSGPSGPGGVSSLGGRRGVGARSGAASGAGSGEPGAVEEVPRARVRGGPAAAGERGVVADRRVSASAAPAPAAPVPAAPVPAAPVPASAAAPPAAVPASIVAAPPAAVPAAVVAAPAAPVASPEVPAAAAGVRTAAPGAAPAAAPAAAASAAPAVDAPAMAVPAVPAASARPVPAAAGFAPGASSAPAGAALAGGSAAAAVPAASAVPAVAVPAASASPSASAAVVVAPVVSAPSVSPSVPAAAVGEGSGPRWPQSGWRGAGSGSGVSGDAAAPAPAPAPAPVPVAGSGGVVAVASGDAPPAPAPARVRGVSGARSGAAGSGAGWPAGWDAAVAGQSEPRPVAGGSGAPGPVWPHVGWVAPRVEGVSAPGSVDAPAVDAPAAEPSAPAAPAPAGPTPSAPAPHR